MKHFIMRSLHVLILRSDLKINPVSFEVDITLHCFVYISFFHMVESNIRKQSMDLCLSEFYSETSVGST